MKTLRQIEAQQRRASMREHALKFREEIHPDSHIYTPKFSERVKQGVFYLELAIDYRNMALRLERAA